MSSFAFPPPPPPPPKASGPESQFHQSPNGYGSQQRSHRGAQHRGRGGNQAQRGGGTRQRGRGGSLGGNNNDAAVNLAAGVKRKVPDSSRSHNGAHNGAQPPPQSRNPKIGVSPAVPSFGFQFPFASAPFVSQPQQEPVTSQTKEKKERTHNVLGLTPNGDEREDSDPEIDEEAQASLPAQAYVQNPNLPNLGLPSEVAKWVAERRRQYPTKARIEQKRQATRQAELVARQAEQAARQAELDRLKQKVIESQKSKAAQELKAKEVKDAKLKSKLDRHVRKAEKLRQQLLQAQAASESVQGQPGEARSSNPTKSNASLGIDYDSDSDQDVAIKESSSDVETSSDNDTSSTESDSEDSSSDEDAPEEQSSKASNTASLPTVRPRPDPIPVPDYLEPFVRKHYCTFFLLNGYCRNQKYKNCRYKHELPATLQGQQNGRPKLYDRLVEQERRKEIMVALQAIKFLGDSGFFNDG